MAIEYQTHAIGLEDNQSTTVTVAKPTGTVEGDFLLAAHVHVDQSAAPTRPAGFVLATSGNQSLVRLDVSYKIATGSEPADYTWTTTASGEKAACIIRLTGVDTSNPIDVADNLPDASNATVDCPDVTTLTSNTLVFRFGSGANGDRTITGSPAGQTILFETKSGVQSQDAHLTCAYKTQASPAAVGVATWTFSSSITNHVGATVALKEAASNSWFNTIFSKSVRRGGRVFGIRGNYVVRERMLDG